MRHRAEPHIEGVVVETFYENGEGGMHVCYEHGISWTHWERVEIVERTEKQ